MYINRKLLIDRLNSTWSGLATREIYEQTGSFILMDDRLITFNGEVSVSVPLLSGIKAAVPHKQLYELLRRTSGIDIELWLDGSDLVVKSNTDMTARVGITEDILLPIDIIPKVDDGLWGNLEDGITVKYGYCLQTVSKNMAKPVLTTVHWKENVIESTDNYQITRCTTNTSLPDGVEVLLPSSSVSELVKHDPAFYQIADGWVHFKTLDSTIFSCRTFDGSFPDTSKALELRSNIPIKFSPRLPKILERAITLAVTDSVGDYRVKVTIENDRLTVHSGQDFRQFEESCGISCHHHEKFEFTINPQFFIKMLKAEANAGLIDTQGKKLYLRLERVGVTRLMVLTKVASGDE